MGETTLQAADGRWPLAYALGVAEDLKALLAPTCERVAIAGSVRRRRETVKDIELVVIPRYQASMNLFGEGEKRTDLLSMVIDAYMNIDGIFSKRMNTAGRPIGYGPLNKYLVHVPTGLAVDIFTATPENWGMAMVVRTGPKELNVRMMQRFRELGMEGGVYWVKHVIEEIPVPDEETVFRLLQWPYVRPEARK